MRQNSGSIWLRMLKNEPGWFPTQVCEGWKKQGMKDPLKEIRDERSTKNGAICLLVIAILFLAAGMIKLTEERGDLAIFSFVFAFSFLIIAALLAWNYLQRNAADQFWNCLKIALDAWDIGFRKLAVTNWSDLCQMTDRNLVSLASAVRACQENIVAGTDRNIQCRRTEEEKAWQKFRQTYEAFTLLGTTNGQVVDDYIEQARQKREAPPPTT